MRWKVLKSTDVFKAGFFKLRVDELQLPDGRVQPRYYVLEFPDWVNVVPVTAEGNMIMVTQYRHGVGQTFLEVPGGSADSLSEDPLVAGQRELREETGYTSNDWVNCGFHYPNPGLQSNKMHTFLALNCLPTAAQELDAFEDLEVTTRPITQVYEELRQGEVKHSLIAASLGLALRHLRTRGFVK